MAAAAGLAQGRLRALLAMAAAASVADELRIGMRPLRKVLKQRTAHNVLAEIQPRRSVKRTLVVHAHHDAARTGIVFHPEGAKLMTRMAGELIERVGATPPVMWGAVLGPAAVAAGG